MSCRGRPTISAARRPSIAAACPFNVSRRAVPSARSGGRTGRRWSGRTGRGTRVRLDRIALGRRGCGARAAPADAEPMRASTASPRQWPGSRPRGATRRRCRRGDADGHDERGWRARRSKPVRRRTPSTAPGMTGSWSEAGAPCIHRPEEVGVGEVPVRQRHRGAAHQQAPVLAHRAMALRESSRTPS